MPRETSQNVVNALRLLECFAKEEELGITELSEAIGVGKTATSRLVSSLEGFGYLRQNPATKKYRLGMKLVYLGSLVQDRQEMVRMVSDTLSPFDAELESAEEKPMMFPPKFNMAASWLSLVLVLGS